MTYQSEPWSQAESDIRSVVDAHWQELAVLKSRIKLDVDWQHYRDCHTRGILQVTTARLDNGKLAGYWISIVNIHPHYRETVCAFQDSYFLLQDYRKAEIGIALMLEMQKNVKAMGAVCMIGSDKEHMPMSALFDFVGWPSVGTQYMKWIGD